MNPQSRCGRHGGARCPGRGDTCRFDRATRDLVRPNAGRFGVRCGKGICLFVSFKTDHCRSCGAGQGPGTSPVSRTDMAPGPGARAPKGGDTKQPANPHTPAVWIHTQRAAWLPRRVSLLPVFQSEHADSSGGGRRRDVAPRRRASPLNAPAGDSANGLPGSRS